MAQPERKPMSSAADRFFDLESFRATPLVAEPFPFVIVPGFVRRGELEAIHADFPRITRGGSFPSTSLNYGGVFADLLAALEGPELARLVEEKFAMDLSGRPTMVTVRGLSRPSDGQIHCDSASKLVTVLVYLNDQWRDQGGQLRLLRSADNLEDVVAEVPPEAGTIVAFKVTENGWHGHTPFVGPRRVLQLNWVRDASVVRREQARHRLSARLKRLNPFAGIAAQQ